MQFKNRAEAGRLLATKLMNYSHQPGLQVLALPRGGVEVGAEIARTLGAPLRVFLVRKLGVPGHPEFAFGAIASGGVVYLNEEVVRRLNLSPEAIQEVKRNEEQELKRREQEYGNSPEIGDIEGRTLILVDDGIATGSTVIAAIRAVRQQHPAKVIVAAPVAPSTAVEQLAQEADETIFVLTPEEFSSVGEWYRDFSQLTDREVTEMVQEFAPVSKVKI